VLVAIALMVALLVVATIALVQILQNL